MPKESSIALEKQALRERMKKERMALSQEFQENCAASFWHGLQDFPPYLKADFVMLYMDFKKEAPTGLLLRHILEDEKIAVLPKTDARFSITPYRLPKNALWSYSKPESKSEPKPEPEPASKSLRPSLFLPSPLGILEPNPTLCSLLDPKKIQLILLPGLAFDAKGNRLGFGRGCYDRFLSLCPNAFRLGLAYDFQAQPAVSAGPEDIPVHAVLTEKRLFFCSSYKPAP